MTREEEIKQKAYEISQRCFPDSQNIWARQNIEAQLVQSACCEIVKWADKTMINKACEWLVSELYHSEDRYGHPNVESRSYVSVEDFINDFKKAMEEQV